MDLSAKTTQWKTVIVSCLNPYPVYRCKIFPGFLASRLNLLAKTTWWKTFTVSCLNPYPVYRCKIYVFQVFGLTKFVRPNNGSSPSLQPILDRWIGCRSTYSDQNEFSLPVSRLYLLPLQMASILCLDMRSKAPLGATALYQTCITCRRTNYPLRYCSYCSG